jgi:hypothetical protein
MSTAISTKPLRNVSFVIFISLMNKLSSPKSLTHWAHINDQMQIFSTLCNKIPIFFIRSSLNIRTHFLYDFHSLLLREQIGDLSIIKYITYILDHRFLDYLCIGIHKNSFFLINTSHFHNFL